MQTRFLTTFLAVTAGFCLVFILPTNVELAQPRLEPELPTFVGDWFGEPVKVTQAELNALAKDTEFSRRLYTDSSGELELQVSIILSGHDLNNSIHRPERCLNAQGWSITDSEDVAISPPEFADTNESDVVITRLHQARIVDIPATNSKYAPGSVRQTYGVTGYFFVGAEAITSSHYTRTFVDMWTRLTMGQNQRWAFVMVSGSYGSLVIPPEGLTAEQQELSDQALAEQRALLEGKINDFLVNFLPQALDSEQA
jgi:hypothetical protein